MTDIIIRRANPDAPVPGSHLWVVLPDMHLSEEYKWPVSEAVLCALEAIRWLKPQGVLLMGDMIDVGSLSRFPRSRVGDAAPDFYKDEIEPMILFLDTVQALQPRGGRLVYLEGNHEARVARAAAESPQLAAVQKLIDPQRLFSAGRERFTWVPYHGKAFDQCHYTLAHKLWAVHGWSHAKAAARTHMDMGRDLSIVYGHTHRAESVTSRMPDGDRVIEAWSPGHLGPNQPTWKHCFPTDWTQGISLVYVNDARTSWQKMNLRIERGRVILPSGRKLSAC